MRNLTTRLLCGALAIISTVGELASAQTAQGTPQTTVTPGKMPQIATVDDRFESYNVEMIEVTGGKFWKPYKDLASGHSQQQDGSSATPAGMNPNMYQYRPPIDLTNRRLRALAAALGPAYVRVSGTWANETFFQNSNGPAPAAPPKGFSGVLTREQWKGVVDFSRAAKASIVTSFATSAGTRDAAGVWTPAQARQLITYTKSIGGAIAAAEFMNEPTYAEMGGAAKGYDAAAYARDIAVFRPFFKQAVPGALFLGPGSVAEGGSFPITLGTGMITSEDLLKATGPVFDAFSYHLYAATSERCASMGAKLQVAAADALSREWFARIDAINGFYAGLRDRFDPGKPLWITETADAACGGNPWASTFLDTFRYLYEHGRLAQNGLRVIMHNTLASSDYGLLDENTFAPRPNYWAALVWRKLMGTVVLDPGPSSSPNVYLFAHCLRNHSGGVAMLAINADPQSAHNIQLPNESERYTLSAGQPEDKTIKLNGRVLAMGTNDGLPAIRGVRTAPGSVTLAPRTISFFAVSNTGNDSCR